MPRTKTAVHTPGEQPPAMTASEVGAAVESTPPKKPKPKVARAKDVPAEEDDGGESQRLAAVEADNVQLRAMLQLLIERGTIVPPAKDAPVQQAKLIGEDIRPMTSAQYMAEIKAGNLAEPKTQVLCADGYYVPKILKVD